MNRCLKQKANKHVNTDRPKLRRFALHLCAPGYAKRYVFEASEY